MELLKFTYSIQIFGLINLRFGKSDKIILQLEFELI